MQLFFQVRRDLNFCRSHFNAKLYVCLPDLVENFHFLQLHNFSDKITKQEMPFSSWETFYDKPQEKARNYKYCIHLTGRRRTDN